MFIYNVTVNIEEPVADDWLQWMKTTHIPDVLRTGLFSESKMVRVLADEDSGGRTYSIQYYFKSMDDFNLYEEKFAPALRAEHTARYREKFVAFRTLLEVVD